MQNNAKERDVVIPATRKIPDPEACESSCLSDDSATNCDVAYLTALVSWPTPRSGGLE